MNPRPGAIRTIGVLVVAAIVVIAFVYMNFRADVPAADESRRVRHPAGFSIIVPPEWHTELLYPPKSPDTIWAVPEKTESVVGGLWAVKYASKPDFRTSGRKALVPGEFQGQPAWVSEDLQGKKTRSRTYLFERDGAWYAVILTRPSVEAVMGQRWTEYVNSFRLEAPTQRPPEITFSATQPSVDMIPTPTPSENNDDSGFVAP